MSGLVRASTSMFARRRAACSCAKRLFSSSASSSTLPAPLPLHAHPNSRDPAPFPASPETPSPLALIASQPSQYISALLLGRRYLLTPNDILTVPKLKGVKPGDVLALTRILEVGSRDYTLRAAAPPHSPTASVVSAQLAANKLPLLTPALSRSVVRDGIPRDWQRHPDSLPALGEHVVKGSLVVLEHTKGTMFEVEKFKRRKGYRRTLRSKLGFTRLRVGDIQFGEVN